MSESNDYLEMTFHSIKCFSNDGVLDVSELEQIVRIAQKNGVVDDNEKRVLINILNRLKGSELQGDLGARIDELRQKYSI